MSTWLPHSLHHPRHHAPEIALTAPQNPAAIPLVVHDCATACARGARHHWGSLDLAAAPCRGTAGRDANNRGRWPHGADEMRWSAHPIWRPGTWTRPSLQPRPMGWTSSPVPTHTRRLPPARHSCVTPRVLGVWVCGCVCVSEPTGLPVCVCTCACVCGEGVVLIHDLFASELHRCKRLSVGGAWRWGGWRQIFERPA